ncbi:MAG: hypothetical protein U0234_00665 [Sandaracinus sp.]
MTSASADTAHVREGPVDRSQAHFELCYGRGDDDPDTWVVVARVPCDVDNRAIIEITLDPSRADYDALVRSAWGQIAAVVQEPKDENRSGIIWRADADGMPTVYAWAMSLAQLCGSTASGYGNWHWRGREGTASS